MNTEFLILRTIFEDKTASQREISRTLDVSLGKINQLFKDIEKKGLITANEQYKLTPKGRAFLEQNRVDTAIILAKEEIIKNEKGIYVPIGLREIDGEAIIERNIRFLLEKNIKNIYLVAGNLIEGYEYLIDKYKINFVYDYEYEKKGSLSKLLKVQDVLENHNTYILLSNVYLEKNAYHSYETEPFIYGQYMEDIEDNVCLLFNNKSELMSVQDGGERQYSLTHISFLTKEYSEKFVKLLKGYDKLPSANSFSYEDALIRNLDILPEIYVHKLRDKIYTDLKRNIDFAIYDRRFLNKNKFPMTNIISALNIREKDIVDIKMEESVEDTKVFSFSIMKKEYDNKRYIVREVGEAKKICRDIGSEKVLYNKLKDTEFFENIISIDSDYRVIKEAFDEYRVIDLKDEEVRKIVLHMFRKMHNTKIDIDKELDIEDMIDEYVDILNKKHIDVLYKDFKENLYMVKKMIYFLRGGKRPKVICKNFISADDICYTSDGLRIQNIETVALNDPLIDIAAISSFVDMTPVDIIKVYEEYNNMVDINNIAMQNIDKARARNYVVCFLAIQYFVSAMKILMRENMYMNKEGDCGYRKYRLFKKCLDYIQKNKIV